MNKALSVAIERVTALPESRQEDIARIMTDIVEHEELAQRWTLSADQIAEVEAALAEDGPYATDEEMEEFFARYRM